MPGRAAFATFSDLPEDQFGRLLGMQQFFAWWFVGLVVLGLLGAVREFVGRRSPTTAVASPQDVVRA